MKISSSSSSKPLLCFLLFLSVAITTHCATPKCNAQDKRALLQFKAALAKNNPGFLDNWSANGDCCEWLQVRCSDATARVTQLLVLDQTISGEIPPAVGDLPYLTYLAFSSTGNLTGRLPSFLSKLTHLQILDLRSNKFYGPVPSFLSQLKNLTHLQLSSNHLIGSIPPSLSQLPNLENLYLDGNRLTGSIPESFGHWAGKTPNIILAHNYLTGPVPKSFGKLNFSGGVIDLSRNKLQGDPSFLFGKNKSAFSIDLSKNMFKFDFSKVQFPESLTMLDLNHNNIFGSIPQGLTQVDFSPNSLNLSYNRLCGKIPQGGNLQSFAASAYSNNKCLCGAPLPPCKK